MKMLIDRQFKLQNQHAILQELVDDNTPWQARPIVFGVFGSVEVMITGLIAGSAEASKLFVAIIAEMLLKIRKNGRMRGRVSFVGNFREAHLRLTNFTSIFSTTFGTWILSQIMLQF